MVGAEGTVSLALDRLGGHLARRPTVRRRGRVLQVVGTVIEAELPGVAVGELACIGETYAEVVGFRESRALLMPLGTLQGIAHGALVEVRSQVLSVPVGPGLLGRVIDPLGEPMDGRPLEDCSGRRPLMGSAPDPMKRHVISKPLETGVRVIDGLLTMGRGQRVAVMAGSGVGKSTLMGMVARNCRADVNVVALIGERGREVREFLERDLGAEGLARSVVVIATSDHSPVLQVKAMLAAIAVAEHFRDAGKDVLFMADSLTRLAMAQRQIGLAAGEPPATKGYTPSVFTLMPRLLERLGPGAPVGSITGFLTVLVEGEDMDDPVADMVRGIVDGHIVLARRLASLGHYPAIDVLQSVSRTMPSTVLPAHVAVATRVRAMMATYRENEELIRLGAYKQGADADVDTAILANPQINSFLRQPVHDATGFADCVKRLQQVASIRAQAQRGRRAKLRRPRGG
jgi:flagellum-specific ATP synthase